MDFDKLDKAIFQGLRDACFESVRFNQFLYPDIKPEYLLTVNIAQSLLAEFPDEFVIKIEEQTEDFKRTSTELGDLIRFFNTLKNFVIERNGRIDIGLHNKLGDSIGLIEVKGFNQPDNLIVKDIERIIDFLSDTHGLNNIYFGVSAFLVEHKMCCLKTKKQEGIDSFKDRYSKLIDSEFKEHYGTIDFKINVDTSYDELMTDEEFESIDDEDMADTLKEKAHYIGVAIEVIKKGSR
jgi:hypothetical protein